MSNFQTMARELQRLRDSGRPLPPAVAESMASLDRLDAQIGKARAELDAAMDTAQRSAIAGTLDPAELDDVSRAKARVQILEGALLAQLGTAYTAADAAGVLPPRRTRPGALPTVKAGAFQ